MMLFQKIQSITIAELKGKLTSSIQLIDVRTPNEYQSGHIRQSKNVPLQRITSFKGNQTKSVYVICQSGMRSKQATKELNKMGYQAINVRGGMNQWLDKTTGGK